MIIFFHLNTRIEQRLSFGTIHELKKRLATAKGRSSRVPIADLHVQHGKDAVAAPAVDAVQRDDAVLRIIRFLLIVNQGAEHRVAMAQMVAIDGDVLAGLPIVRAFQRKQASQLTFLSIEQVAQVICGIIRTNDGIADHGAGNRKPGNEVLVLGKTRLQINA